MRSISLSFILLFIVASFSSSAQEAPRTESKIFVGGNFGLQFGTNYTVVNVSPLVGYRFTEKFSSGVGGTYEYYKIKEPYYTFHTNIYGASIFSRYLVFNNIFLHAEYEELSLEQYNYFENITRRIWVPGLFLGGGIQQPIGSRGFLQFLVLFDVIQDPNSPYQNPVIRAGVGFGL
jgi:hypothetical protein